ncbi:helix-turn-helix transcriptional regulator [Mesorhizobium sp. J8]|nr:helix-turn-helix transcriptional regulator [Mesorhizobium sp. J8]
MWSSVSRPNTLSRCVFVLHIEQQNRSVVKQVSVRYTSNDANHSKHWENLQSMPATLREKLKRLRTAKGYSLDELARLSGASKSYLWELENRDERKPSAEKLVEIARVLDVTTDYLTDDKAEFDDAQVKEAFFRKFNRLDDDTKSKIMDMIDTWSKKK